MALALNRRGYAMLAGALLACASPGLGWAGEVREDARAAYDRALAAAKAGDAATAAREFARADELVPSAVALTSALRAALEAGDALLALELSERSEGRAAESGAERDFRSAAAEARARFAAAHARIVLGCAAGHDCEAQLAGTAVPLGRGRWLAPGRYRLAVTVDRVASERELELAAGARLMLVLEPPAPLPAAPVEAAPVPRAPRVAAEPPPARSPAEDAASGLSPAWFFVGLGVTAALGAATIASAVDTSDRHDAFVATGSGAEDGEAAQLRTNLLFVGTLAGALGTAALAVFAVDWSGPDEPARSARLLLMPTAVGLEASF